MCSLSGNKVFSKQHGAALEVGYPPTYFTAGTLGAPQQLFAAVGSGVEVAVLGICSRVAIVALGTLLYVLVGVAIASAGS